MARAAANAPAKGTAKLDRTGGSLEELIGYNLKRAYILVQTDFREALADENLAPRVFSALSLAVEKPGITQSDVARHLRIERSGLVAIVDDLEQRKLIRRMPVTGDRRVQALHPTVEGQATYTRALRAVHEHEDRFFKMLTSEEHSQLLALLQRVRQGSEEET